jgi:uncharacterized membrane protein YukC
MDWNTFWFIVVIAILVIALVLVIAWYFSLRKKRRALPSHVDMYFDENFRKIMDEWDMVSRDKVKSFKRSMNTRLTKVGKNIDDLEKSKRKLESRLGSVEREMERLERF